MRRYLSLLPLLCAGMAACVAQAAHDPVPAMIYDPAPLARIEPQQHAQFRQIDAELRNVVRRRGDRRVANRFCVAGYRFADGQLETVLFWEQAQWLIRWRGGDPQGAGERDAVSASFSRVIDLRHDLVEDARFPLGTGAVLRVDAEALLADCRRHGRHYTVPPLPPRAEDEDF